MRNIETVYQAMIEYYRGDSHQIQHFAKVHTYSRLIGTLEGLDEETMITLEMAALVHDVGIKAGMEKYGRGNGKIPGDDTGRHERNCFGNALSKRSRLFDLVSE